MGGLLILVVLGVIAGMLVYGALEGVMKGLQCAVDHGFPMWIIVLIFILILFL